MICFSVDRYIHGRLYARLPSSKNNRHLATVRHPSKFHLMALNIQGLTKYVCYQKFRCASYQFPLRVAGDRRILPGREAGGVALFAAGVVDAVRHLDIDVAVAA